MGLWDWLEDVAEGGEVVFDIAQKVPLQLGETFFDIATIVAPKPLTTLWDIATFTTDPLTLIAPYVSEPTLAKLEEVAEEVAAAKEKAEADEHALAVAKARKQLGYFLLAGGALVGIPALYALSVAASKKRGAKLTPKQEMIGKALENASAQATGLGITALASPIVAMAASYILIQKLEDAEYISKGLGNAAQTLLTVSAAGPAISGIGGIIGSAFKVIPKGAKA